MALLNCQLVGQNLPNWRLCGAQLTDFAYTTDYTLMCWVEAPTRPQANRQFVQLRAQTPQGTLHVPGVIVAVENTLNPKVFGLTVRAPFHVLDKIHQRYFAHRTLQEITQQLCQAVHWPHIYQVTHQTDIPLAIQDKESDWAFLSRLWTNAGQLAYFDIRDEGKCYIAQAAPTCHSWGVLPVTLLAYQQHWLPDAVVFSGHDIETGHQLSFHEAAETLGTTTCYRATQAQAAAHQNHCQQRQRARQTRLRVRVSESWLNVGDTFEMAQDGINGCFQVVAYDINIEGLPNQSFSFVQTIEAIPAHLPYQKPLLQESLIPRMGKVVQLLSPDTVIVRFESGPDDIKATCLKPYSDAHAGVHIDLIPGTTVCVGFVEGQATAPIVLGTLPATQHGDSFHTSADYHWRTPQQQGFLWGGPAAESRLYTKNSALTLQREPNQISLTAPDCHVAAQTLQIQAGHIQMKGQTLNIQTDTHQSTGEVSEWSATKLYTESQSLNYKNQSFCLQGQTIHWSARQLGIQSNTLMIKGKKTTMAGAQIQWKSSASITLQCGGSQLKLTDNRLDIKTTRFIMAGQSVRFVPFALAP